MHSRLRVGAHLAPRKGPGWLSASPPRSQLVARDMGRGVDAFGVRGCSGTEACRVRPAGAVRCRLSQRADTCTAQGEDWRAPWQSSRCTCCCCCC